MHRVDWATGVLQGPEVQSSHKTIGDLGNLFLDRAAAEKLAEDTLIYSVQWWSPVPDQTEGGLFWGNTTIEPGQVGREYFMTHGHLHAKADRTEFYSTIEGTGALILMNDDRQTRMEPMTPGSLHHIPPRTAHRVANTGANPLRFVACWPSDAGYDYEMIRTEGFSARLLAINGTPTLVDQASLRG
jgi:glucose-6-phosphate isomerase, archaeal